MSGENAIEAPYTIATLPKPFDAGGGKTFASPVHGYRGQKRRKRPEIAVSVDGEGISIFHVRCCLLSCTSNLKTHSFKGPEHAPHQFIRSATANPLYLPAMFYLPQIDRPEIHSTAHLRCCAQCYERKV